MKFFQLIPSDTNIDFVGKFKFFFIGSFLLCGAIAVAIVVKGLNYGIDFTGGTVIQAKFTPAMAPEAVRSLTVELGADDASVVSLGDAGQEYLITVRSHTEPNVAPLNQKLSDKLGKAVEIQSVDVVGPKVGAELKNAAILSLFYSIILITIYIWLRFDIRFAPGATVAMIHDLLMAAGFYLLTGREFTITAIAALLTIAGYSVNDTIVIYDRVREMYKLGGADMPLAGTVNKAINVTLSRTLLTAFVTLISVIPIIIFCTGEIQSFAIAMCFGIFVGAYSTVYIASPLTIYVAKYLDGRKAKSRPRRTVTA